MLSIYPPSKPQLTIGATTGKMIKSDKDTRWKNIDINILTFNLRCKCYSYKHALHIFLNLSCKTPIILTDSLKIDKQWAHNSGLLMILGENKSMILHNLSDCRPIAILRKISISGSFFSNLTKFFRAANLENMLTASDKLWKISELTFTTESFYCHVIYLQLATSTKTDITTAAFLGIFQIFKNSVFGRIASFWNSSKILMVNQLSKQPHEVKVATAKPRQKCCQCSW